VTTEYSGAGSAAASLDERVSGKEKSRATARLFRRSGIAFASYQWCDGLMGRPPPLDDEPDEPDELDELDGDSLRDGGGGGGDRGASTCGGGALRGADSTRGGGDWRAAGSLRSPEGRGASTGVLRAKPRGSLSLGAMRSCDKPRCSCVDKSP
jgi:hypothetical protein